MNLSTQTQDSGKEKMLLVDSYYTIQDSGYGEGSMPLIHLCGRNTEGERRVVTVEGFRPRFYVSEQEFIQNRDTIEKQLQKRSSSLMDYGMNHRLMDGRDQIDGVMLVCELPTDVSDLRDEFDRHWEADIQFTDAFKLEKDVKQYVSVPRGVSEVHHDQIKSADDTGVSINERVLTFDIEVSTDGGGFPDYESPTAPLTSIAAHDSFTDDCWVGVVHHESWSETDVENIRSIDNADTITLYKDDKSMLYDFVSYLSDIQMDVFTGWSSNSFDVPYTINRALKLNVGGLENLSPTKDVSWISDAPRNTNYGLKGILCLDALECFKAVNIGQRKSYKLEDISVEELGYGKDDVEDFDAAWKNRPVEFVRYNTKDVTLVREILESSDALTDFRGRRELTGTDLANCDYPKNLVGPAFLSHAREYINE